MEKQTKIYINSIIFILFCLLFFNCNKKNDKNFKIESSIKEIKSNYKLDIDTVVNKFYLSDSISILKNVGKIYNIIEQDSYRGECATLINKYNNQYLKMRREYGGSSHKFDYFYVGLSKNVNFIKYKILNDSIFISNKGAFIGMNEHDFIKKYSNINFIKNLKIDTILYKFRDEYNTYECNYIFVKGKLIEYEFGYQDD